MGASTDDDTGGGRATTPPAPPKRLTLAQQRALLAIARAAIARKLGRTSGLAPPVDDDALRAPRGAFATCLSSTPDAADEEATVALRVRRILNQQTPPSHPLTPPPEPFAPPT